MGYSSRDYDDSYRRNGGQGGQRQWGQRREQPPYFQVRPAKDGQLPDLIFVFNSFKIKDDLKDAGFQYDGTLKCWIHDDTDGVRELMDRLEVPESEYRAEGQSKLPPASAQQPSTKPPAKQPEPLPKPDTSPVYSSPRDYIARSGIVLLLGQIEAKLSELDKRPIPDNASAADTWLMRGRLNLRNARFAFTQYADGAE